MGDTGTSMLPSVKLYLCLLLGDVGFEMVLKSFIPLMGENHLAH